MTLRIGLYGGSFDPPHLAHLALARVARDTLALDELRWQPAGQPWQKPGRLVASPAQREAMLRRLVDDEPGFVIDTRELQRQGPSYTVDTVREVAAEQPGAALFLVIGADQFAQLDTWKDAADIALLATLAVAAREGQAVRPPAAWAGAPLAWRELPLPRIDISATEVRRRAAAGEPVSPLVGEAVAGYIDQQQLYRAAPGH
ncbi:nicotinate-nucleotide adenylyltransferase [Ideonella sp.]|uniref:nicotinate-nucleotide adenylyltransferase n=1 Tax=Ideonella sp. TaxID=1929293 RepID=UPI0035B3F5D6